MVMIDMYISTYLQTSPALWQFKALSVNTDLAILMFPEAGEWLVKRVPWPPKLVHT